MNLDVFEKSLKSFWKWMMNSNMSNSSNSVERLRWKWKRICFAPRPFQDGTAKRRRHSTVHVHDSLLSLPVFLCGKGSKGSAVTAVVLGFCTCFRRSTRWRPTQFVATCVRDLVVVIRSFWIFAW